jgi:hypothetical protein
MQSLGRLALIGRILRRETIKPRDAEPLELGEVVAKGARLRGAAARARDLIQPSGGACPAAGARIDDHGAPESFDRSTLDPSSQRERQRRKRRGGAPPVILRNGMSAGDIGIVHGGHARSRQRDTK